MILDNLYELGESFYTADLICKRGPNLISKFDLFCQGDLFLEFEKYVPVLKGDS